MNKSELNLIGDDIERIAKCPRCRSDNLHHVALERWDRDEDSKNEKYTYASDDKTSVEYVESSHSRNPSARRSGISIHFTCESCGGGKPKDRIELCIYQHKGQTFLEWRYDETSSQADGEFR